MPAEVHYSYPVLTVKQAAILEALSTDCLFPSEIAKTTSYPIPTLSATLKNLFNEGLVNCSHQGTRPSYELSDRGKRALAAHKAALKQWER